MSRAISNGVPPLQNILDRFAKSKRTTDGWLVSCPVPGHGKGGGDRNPSLSVAEGADGRVLVRCFAGCPPEAVVQAIGLTMADLFVHQERTPRPPAEPMHRNNGAVEPRNRATLDRMAQYCRLPREHLQALGWRDAADGVVIPYRFANGQPARNKRRFTLEKPDDGTDHQKFDPSSKLAITLYGAELVPRWSKDGVDELHLVEGETDSAVLRHVGAAVLGIPGAEHYGKVALEHVHHATTIYLYREPDKGGDTLRAKLPERLRAIGWRGVLRIVKMAETGYKDIRDAWIADPERFTAEPWPRMLAAAERVEIDAASSSPAKRAVTLAELRALNLPPRELLLAPWLHRKSNNMIVAERGVGKTWTVHGIALAVAAGGSFLRWTAPKPRGVLLIDGEMSTEELLHDRLPPMADALGLDPGDRLKILAADLDGQGLLPLNTKEGQADVEEHLDGVDLVIIDNLSALFGGLEENSATEWQPAKRWLLSLKLRGLGVLLAHHSSRGSKNPRGTSAREDALDALAFLSRPDDYDDGADDARFIVHLTKGRTLRAKDKVPFEAKLVEGRWTCEEARDEVLQEVADMTAEGKTVRQIATATGKGRSTVSRLQAKARQTGLIK